MAAPAVLLVSWPDKVRLEVQDPVGSTLALLVVNQGKFWWYSSDQKEITVGKIEKLGTLGLPFAQDFVRVLLARPDISQWNGAQGAGAKRLRQNQDGSQEVLEWSDRLEEPLVWKRLFPSQEQYAAEYEDYQIRYGASFPGRIRLTQKKDRRQNVLTWVWKDWAPTVPTQTKLFQIPQEQRYGRKIKVLP